jgi:hypothetical protein
MGKTSLQLHFSGHIDYRTLDSTFIHENLKDMTNHRQKEPLALIGMVNLEIDRQMANLLISKGIDAARAPLAIEVSALRGL